MKMENKIFCISTERHTGTRLTGMSTGKANSKEVGGAQLSNYWQDVWKISLDLK